MFTTVVIVECVSRAGGLETGIVLPVLNVFSQSSFDPDTCPAILDGQHEHLRGRCSKELS